MILSGSKKVNIEKHGTEIVELKIPKKLFVNSFDRVGQYSINHAWPTTLFVNQKKLELARWPKKKAWE